MSNSAQEDNTCNIYEIRNLWYRHGKRVQNNDPEKFKDQLPNVHENIDLERIKAEQRKDKYALPIIEYMESNILHDDNKVARNLLLEID